MYDEKEDLVVEDNLLASPPPTSPDELATTSSISQQDDNIIIPPIVLGSPPPSQSFVIPIIQPSNRITSSRSQDVTKPLTSVGKHYIQPGFERFFQTWYHDVCLLQQNHFPGYLSSELFKPVASSNDYISVIRYDSYEHLQAWRTSPQRRIMSERAKLFSREPAQLTLHSVECLFINNNHHNHNNVLDRTKQSPPYDHEEEDDNEEEDVTPSDVTPIRPPTKYKMVLILSFCSWGQNQWTPKVWMGILGPDTLPKWLFQYLGTLLTGIVVAFVVLPIVTGLLGFWLFPNVPYRTSLRNGFMSLPWPIPKIVSWLSSSSSSLVVSNHATQVLDIEVAKDVEFDKNARETLEGNLETNNSNILTSSTIASGDGDKLETLTGESRR